MDYSPIRYSHQQPACQRCLRCILSRHCTPFAPVRHPEGFQPRVMADPLCARALSQCIGSLLVRDVGQFGVPLLLQRLLQSLETRAGAGEATGPAVDRSVSSAATTRGALICTAMGPSRLHWQDVDAEQE